MKKLIFILLLFISFQSFGQNRFPSIDSAKAYTLRYYRNSTVETFTNYRGQNIAYGTLELLDSITSAMSSGGVDSVWISSSATKDSIKYSKSGTTYTAGTLDKASLRLLITDTSSMLAPYVRRQELIDSMSAVQNRLDTTRNGIRTDLNGKQGALTLTTTGSSGASTLIGNTLNIPQYSGGGGSVVVNDSLAYGFKTADSSVSGQTKTPVDLSWSLASKQKVFEILDQNHIHYRSHFDGGSLSDIYKVTGTTPELTTSGKLSVTGNTLLRTDVGPKAPFFTIVADIYEMGNTATAATPVQIGPALVKDSSNFISAVYDANGHTIRVYINNVLKSTTSNLYLNEKGLKIYLQYAATKIIVWYESDGKKNLVTTVTSTTDLRLPDSIALYKYGIQSIQSTSATHYVNLLAAGASGGAGLLNPKVVTNDDGSPYLMGNKFLITADWVPTASIAVAYQQENSTIFAIDKDNFSIETVGRLYFKRSNFKNDNVTRIVGGAATHLRWFPDRKQWMLTYTFADDPTVEVAEYWDDDDVYIWLNYDEVFGENIISQERYETFGFDKTTSPNLIYDVSYRRDANDGTHYVLGDYTRLSYVNPRLFYGSTLGNLNQTVSKDTTMFLEGCTWAKLGGEWYAVYWSYGQDKGIVLDFPSLNTVGFLNLPFTSSPTRISTYDFTTFNKSNRSEYLMIGFDTTNTFFNGTEYDWARGNLVIWKAVDTSAGFEFASRFHNDVVKTKTTLPSFSNNGFNSVTEGSVGMDNVFWNMNSYYNPATGTFKHRNTGVAGMMTMAQSEFQVRMKLTDAAGDDFVDNNAQIKTNVNGNFGIGGAITPTLNSFTGAYLTGTSTGIGMGAISPSYSLHVKKDQATLTAVTIENASSTSGAEAQFRLVNDQATNTFLTKYGSNTSYAAAVAGTLFLYQSGAAGITLMTDNASGSIKFASGGNSEKVRFDQNGAVSIGSAANANTSSILDITSTTKGLLLPRMTKTQRDAISSPVAGLMIYQTDNTPGLRVYNGSSWMRFTETAD